MIDEVVNGYHRDANNVMVNSTYHHDALQSVLGQSAHDGQIQATQSYTAFGGNLSATGTSNSAQKYTGREEDSESGCYYYRARIYCPGMGRFISEDPKGFAAGVNFYAYANNNPVNGNDPTGLLTSFLWGASNISQEAIGIGSFGNQVALAGATGAASAPLASLAVAGAASVAPLVNGIALTNGLISGASSAVGSLALGGNTQSALISGGAGFAAGYASPLWFTPSFLGNIGKGAALNGMANFAAQRISIGLDPAQSLQDYNIGATIGSALGGGIGSGLTASFGSSSLAMQLSAGVVKFGPSLTAKAIGTSLGAPSASANGGFVLYPNKSNTNMMSSVYAK